jgi:hypothetical protein
VRIRRLVLAILPTLLFFVPSAAHATATAKPARPVYIAPALEAYRATAARTIIAVVSYYTVVPGDSLSAIAERLWGNASLWPALYQANRPRVLDPNVIQPGWVLTVPSQPSVAVTQQALERPAPAPSPHKPAPVGAAPSGSLQAYAQYLLNKVGLGGQFGCLNLVINRESGWRVEVWNTGGSGAYGIGQALPAGKMAVAGADYMTSGYTQLRWMIDDYIVPQYTTPCGAWAHEVAMGWY